jgi:hypothetical protein
MVHPCTASNRPVGRALPCVQRTEWQMCPEVSSLSFFSFCVVKCKHLYACVHLHVCFLFSSLSQNGQHHWCSLGFAFFISIVETVLWNFIDISSLIISVVSGVFQSQRIRCWVNLHVFICMLLKVDTCSRAAGGRGCPREVVLDIVEALAVSPGSPQHSKAEVWWFNMLSQRGARVLGL